MLTFHTISGLAALVTGLAVVLMRKGTTTHRYIGWAYGTAMYSLCLSSFAIPADILPIVGSYGIFHVFAVWGTVQLTAGIIPAIWRDRFSQWYVYHLYNMLWSFVGLVMATNSHFFPYVVRPLLDATGWSVGWVVFVTGLVLWGLPVVIGTVAIERKKAEYKERFADEASAPA